MHHHCDASRRVSLRAYGVRPPRSLSPAAARSHALDAEAVAAQQRGRLHEAVIELLGEQGYGATTVQDLAAAAGVSTTTFYDLFAGKQQLVLDACDASSPRPALPLRDRPAAEGDLRARLAAALTAVVDVVLAQPAAARLALVDIVAVGPPGSRAAAR